MNKKKKSLKLPFYHDYLCPSSFFLALAPVLDWGFLLVISELNASQETPTVSCKGWVSTCTSYSRLHNFDFHAGIRVKMIWSVDSDCSTKSPIILWSPHVLSHCCVLHYFLTMPVGFNFNFNFNLTYGWKPQVGGIKVVTVYKQSIFQVEWLIVTLIYCCFNSCHYFQLFLTQK